VDADVEAVRAALIALDEAFQRRDLAAALALCTQDVVFIGSGEGEVAVGREAIAPMFAALAPHLEHLVFSLGEWESVDVDVLGDVAVLYATAPAELETPNRKASFRYRLTGVLVRHQGRWFWRVHHGSEPGAW
jgi:uncharacterized protein (TIGR02246 family)